jgi:hypothetical protein
LVIAGPSSALEHRAGIVPGMLIIFYAVDEGEVTARQLPPDVVGVPIKMDLAATLHHGLRLHPDPQARSSTHLERRS